VASRLLLFFLAHTLKDDVDATNDSRQINGTVDTDTTGNLRSIPLAPVKGCRAVSSPRVQG
jgi:hypothetical protein